MRPFILTAVFAVLMAGCTKDESGPTGTKGSIAGRVTSTANDSALAAVQVLTVPTTSSVLTDNSGNYQIPDVATGTYAVIAAKTAYIADTANVVVNQGAVAKADFRLSASYGSIVGTVNSATTGSVLSSVQIITQPATSTVFSNTLGNYVILTVPPGAYQVIAAKPGYVPDTVSVTVSQSGTAHANLSVTPSLTTGLVAFYPFNGNANDESGNGYNGVSHGATLTSDRFSNSNSAYQFDGVASYIDLPNTEALNFATGGFTLTAWVKFTEDLYGWSVVGKHVHGYANGFSLDVGAPRAELHVDGQYAFDTTASLMGGWHFVVGTFDGTTGRFYADGQLRATQAMTYVHTNAVTVSIGAFHNAGVGLYFKGSIDDIRIYNRALNASEIAGLTHEGGW